MSSVAGGKRRKSRTPLDAESAIAPSGVFFGF
jgi:hypothetical protein